MTEPIGYATLQVIPSLQGITGDITKQVDGVFGRAGKSAGQSFASGVQSAESAVKAATEKLTKLRDREADAAGKVRVAEAKLEEIRSRGTASAAQIAAAEENYARALRGQQSATRTATSAADELADAERRAANAADDAGDSVDNLGRRGLISGENLAKMGAIAGAGLLGLGKILYDVGSTFDDVSDTIRVGTGATGENLAALEQIAKNVGSTVPASFETIGATVAELNTRLGLTGAPLETLTKQVAELGNLGQEIDIDSLSASFNAFGVEGANTSKVLDELFRVSQATGVPINDLANSALKGGPALKQFGFTLAESAGLIGTLDKSGLDADKMMGGLTKSLTAFAKAGQDPQQALYGTVGEIERFIKAGDQAGAINVAAKLFGVKGAGQFVDAVQQGRLSVDDFVSATGAGSDTILGAAEETRDFAEQWELFKNKTLVAIEPIATRVFGVIGTGMQWITDNGIPALRDFGGWFDQNRTTIAIVAGVITATLLPSLTVMTVGWATAGAAAVKSAALSVAASYRTVGGWVAMAASATLNGAVIATIWTATQVSAAAGWVAMQARAIGAFVATAAASTVNAAIVAAAWVASMARTAASVALATGAFIAQRAILVAGAIATGVMATAQWALNAAMTANPIGIIIALLAGLVAGVVLAYKNSETFRNIVQAAWEGIKVAASFAWNNVLKPALDGLLAALGWVGDKAMWLWQNVMVPAWDAIRGAIEAVWNFIRPILDNIGRGIQVLGEIASKVGDAMRNAFNGVVDVLKAPIHMVGKLLASLPEKVGPITIPFVGTLKSWGQTLQGLAEGGVAGAAGRRRNGQLYGPGTGTSDSILGIDPMTLMPTAFVANGEGVVIEEVMSTPTGSAMVAALNSGWVPSADQMHSMFPGLRGYAAGGVVGEPYGLPAGTSISYGGSGFPDWVNKLGAEHNVKPSTYPGHQESDRGEAGYAPNPQGLNRGIDWSGTVEAMQAFADYLLSVAPTSPGVEQIIWQNPNTGAKIGWAGGQNVTNSGYFDADYAGHQDHVHSRHATALAAVAAPALPQTPQVPDTVTQTPQYAPPATTDPSASTSTMSTGTEQKTRLKTFKELGSEAGGILAEGIGETLGLPDWVMDPNKLMEGDDGSNVRTTDNTATQQQQAPTTTTPPQQQTPPAQPQQQAPPPVDRRGGLTGHAAHVYDIAKAALDAGVGKAGAIIGEATAVVESGDPIKMWANSAVPESLNFPHDDVGSDGTSVGPFQQQNGWGSVADRMNTYKSAGLFYNALKKVDGWQTMDPGAAAQAVQRSAFPDKYGAVMDRARQLVDEAALFDTGGIWQPGTFGFNGLNEPELVLKKNQWGVVADQTKAVRELVGATRGANTGGGLAVTVYGHTAGDIVTEFRREQWRGSAGYGSRGR
ncbi:tape measure protein [Gordonia phage Tarzan]|uniref:Tape measure protein n=1 Tax=Gordonia phage Tarzan TaxID=3038367 RepID=A0AAF0K6T2_9CAUD|nr:tape measure protein [Gordonia phage Tarzan]WGH20051.1 tape measure protein [Gordonia phage Tarzan]